MRFDARLLPHEHHPRGLASLPDPPETLFATADLPEGLAVAIVGTRAADPEHLRFTARLAADLARAGVVVVSGGALGIDAAAHRGALDAAGKTVAVLATGFRKPYPPDHDALFVRIAAEGVLLCEHRDVPAHPGRFLERNRLVAAMADAVVVVQAPVRSGALSTAALARKLGRPVFAVPSAPWDARSAGSTALLTRPGALACTHARDVLRILGATLPIPEPPPSAGRRVPRRSTRPEPQRATLAALAAATPAAAPAAATLGLGEDATLVFTHLGATPIQRDELVSRTGLDVARLQHALLQLLLQGVATELPDGRVARAAAY